MAPLAPLHSLPSSDRVDLRLHDDRDLDLIRLASADPLIPLITTVPAEWSPQAGRDYLARQAGRRAEGVGWSLAIVDRATDRAVGNLFIALQLRQVGVAEVGYWIAAPFRRQGLAAEALALARTWVPDEFGVESVQLYIEPRNEASLRTAAAAGFHVEDLHDCWEKVGDEWRPLHRLGLRGNRLGEVAALARLERCMWRNGFRDDLVWFDHHLHDDFVEFGRSGTLWTREKILAQQIGQIEVELPFTDLAVELVAPDAYLTTYRSVEARGETHRASLWLRTPEGFRLRFHQGTATDSG